MNERARQKLILALDFSTLESALQIARSLSPVVGILKINTHLFTAEGPAAVEKLNQLGPGIFLDLKFHDIPNTVKGAVASAVALPGVQLVDVHALGGLEMMRAAVQSRDETNGSKSPQAKLLAITILTSMDNAALRGVGIAGPASRRVVQLARLAQKAGMDGVVASPREVRAIRRTCGKDFLIVVPGIRPAVGGASPSERKRKTDDQSRVATAAEAVRAGADYLVIGRPITGASDPEAAARAILEEISSALPRNEVHPLSSRKIPADFVSSGPLNSD
ncbi:MAG TPA: orotidine-5'-phosphate decarboxylase [Candidatus Acidoferrales bacterium]|nr:orotidine-5'-phosphate decarboxylase [Candidatus Acidoferrales bacterium]